MNLAIGAVVFDWPSFFTRGACLTGVAGTIATILAAVYFHRRSVPRAAAPATAMAWLPRYRSPNNSRCAFSSSSAYRRRT